MRSRPTYHVVPHFSIAAKDGELELGTVIKSLHSLGPLNRGEIVEIPRIDHYGPVINHGSMAESLSRLSQGYGSVWAQEYALRSVEYSTKLSSDKEQGGIVSCDSLVTTYFDPKQDYVNETLGTTSVNDYIIGTSYKEDVYMITGLKVAKNLRLTWLGTKTFPELGITDAGRQNTEFGPGDIVVGFQAKRYRYLQDRWEQQDDLIHGELYGGYKSVAPQSSVNFEEVTIEIEHGTQRRNGENGGDQDEIWVVHDHEIHES